MGLEERERVEGGMDCQGWIKECGGVVVFD